jgi:hypothetical protein
MIGPLLPEPAIFPFKGDAELSTFVAGVGLHAFHGCLLPTITVLPHVQASKGLILVSFGTLARLPEGQAQILAEVVSSLSDYRIVWKYNGDKPTVGKNVLVSFPCKPSLSPIG